MVLGDWQRLALWLRQQHSRYRGAMIAQELPKSAPELPDIDGKVRRNADGCLLNDAGEVIKSHVSGPSRLTTIEFTNKLSSHVKLFWIDYEGKEQKYLVLKSGQTYVQSTFRTHPWTARACDADGSNEIDDSVVVDNKTVIYPGKQAKKVELRSPSLVDWTKETHIRFAKEFVAQVQTLLLCHHRSENQFAERVNKKYFGSEARRSFEEPSRMTFGALPNDLLMPIINQMTPFGAPLYLEMPNVDPLITDDE